MANCEFGYGNLLYKVPALVVYQKSQCRLISVLFASYLQFKAQVIEKFQANKSAAYRFPLWYSKPENSVLKLIPKFLVELKAPSVLILDSTCSMIFKLGKCPYEKT